MAIIQISIFKMWQVWRSLVDFLPVKRKTTAGGESRQNSSLDYYLKPDEDTQKQVCKNKFLVLGSDSQDLNRDKGER